MMQNPLDSRSPFRTMTCCGSCHRDLLVEVIEATFILLAAMNEAFVESPFPQITPELWRLRRETSGWPRLQMSQ